MDTKKCVNECCIDVGLLLLRVVLAVVFISHGVSKFMNMSGTIGFFGQIGLAPFFVYLVALVETFSGLAMLLGIFVRWAGYLISIVMVVAIVLVKWQKGFFGGYELDLVLLFVALSVSFMGAGRYSFQKGGGCCMGQTGASKSLT